MHEPFDRPGANVMRQKHWEKLHQAEFPWTLIETFLNVFYAFSKFLSSWEETYAQICLMKLDPELLYLWKHFSKQNELYNKLRPEF